MDNKQFDEYVRERLEELLRLRQVKASEYSSRGNAFIHFEKASMLTSLTPEQVIMTYATKQFISLMDLIRIGFRREVIRDQIKEKVGDLIIYLLLLEALVNSDGGQK